MNRALSKSLDVSAGSGHDNNLLPVLIPYKVNLYSFRGAGLLS